MFARQGGDSITPVILEEPVTVEAVRRHGERALEVTLDPETLLQDLSGIKRKLAPILLDGHGVVSVDIAAVDSLSSVTVAALLRIKRICLARGVEMRVCNPNARNLSVMRRCGMLRAIDATPVGAPR